MEKILVTGGAGYIGSHICLKLQESGYLPVVLDNLSNGHRDAISGDIQFVHADIRNRTTLDDTFKKFQPAAVIHMAALIEAGLSMQEPASFYEVNTTGSFNLLEAMRHHECRQIVFSSTAAIYGNTNLDMLDETLPAQPENPYGRSKAMVETMIADYCALYGFRSIALRYFNAAGADPSRRTGERHDPETHLIPLALLAAAGRRDGLKIFGNDYDTPDGTCIRDYVHVDDLAAAHVKAIEHITGETKPFFDCVNIGTGKGCSVREILMLCREVTGIEFPISDAARRTGDPVKLIANPAKANSLLNWKPKYTDPRETIAHAWAYYCSNARKSE